MLERYKKQDFISLWSLGIFLVLLTILNSGCKTKKEPVGHYNNNRPYKCGFALGQDLQRNNLQALAPVIKGNVKVTQFFIHNVIINKNGILDTLPDTSMLTKKPEYPSDSNSLSIDSLFKKNFMYPDTALKFEITGRTLIVFTVNEDGSISEIRPYLSDDRRLKYGIEEEAVRVLGLMSNWKPGYIKTKPVKTIHLVAVFCTLEKPENQKK